MEEFRSSLTHDLTELQLDPDIYLEHVLGLLYYAFEQNGDASELRMFLQECQFEENDSLAIANRMYESFNNAFTTLHNPNTERNDELYYERAETYTCNSNGTNEEVLEYAYDENAAFDLMDLVDQTETLLHNQFNWTQTFPPDVICLALHKANNDISQTANILMQNVNLLSNCKPCRHLLQQRCVRSDCFFDHDLSGIPCKYWLYYGTCTSGESCLFMHDLAHTLMVSSEYVSQKNGADSEQLNIDSSHFPTLLGSVPTTTTSAAAKPKVSTSNLSKQNGNSYTSEAEAFPSLSASVSLLSNTSKKQQKKQKKASNSNVSSAETTSNTYLDAINKPPALSSNEDSRNPQYGSQPSQHSQFSASSLIDALISLGFIVPKSGQTSSQQSSSNWKEGGEALRHNYEKFREEASALAKARNMYLQQATQAYLM